MREAFRAHTTHKDTTHTRIHIAHNYQRLYSRSLFIELHLLLRGFLLYNIIVSITLLLYAWQLVQSFSSCKKYGLQLNYYFLSKRKTRKNAQLRLLHNSHSI